MTSGLDSAQPVYRQHASILRQHAARSPQQSLAANARAEADIKIAPADTFKNEFFIMVSKKIEENSANESRGTQSGGVHICKTGPVGVRSLPV